MDKRGILILAIVLFVSGCNLVRNDTIYDSTILCDDGRRVSIGEGCDPKCVPAGCSNQLCVSEDKAVGIVTTCEYREEYKCFEFSNCGYIDGECKWQETPEYLECLDGLIK